MYLHLGGGDGGLSASQDSRVTSVASNISVVGEGDTSVEVGRCQSVY